MKATAHLVSSQHFSLTYSHCHPLSVSFGDPGHFYCHNHVSTWIWCLESMEGMLSLDYHSDLSFSPPSLSATIVLIPKPWYLIYKYLHQIPLFIQDLFLLYRYFSKNIQGKELKNFSWVWVQEFPRK